MKNKLPVRPNFDGFILSTNKAAKLTFSAADSFCPPFGPREPQTVLGPVTTRKISD